MNDVPTRERPKDHEAPKPSPVLQTSSLSSAGPRCISQGLGCFSLLLVTSNEFSHTSPRPKLLLNGVQGLTYCRVA